MSGGDGAGGGARVGRVIGQALALVAAAGAIAVVHGLSVPALPLEAEATTVDLGAARPVERPREAAGGVGSGGDGSLLDPAFERGTGTGDGVAAGEPGPDGTPEPEPGLGPEVGPEPGVGVAAGDPGLGAVESCDGLVLESRIDLATAATLWRCHYERFEKTVWFFDARSKDKFDAGRIEESIWMPLSRVSGPVMEALQADPVVLPDDVIVVYCIGGDCDESENTVAALQQLGYSNLLIMDAGYRDWEAAGLPVEAGSVFEGFWE